MKRPRILHRKNLKKIQDSVKFGIRKRKLTITMAVLRILLSAIIVLAVLNQRKNLSLLLFLLTAAIAFLDGFIAKRKKKISQLHSIVDLLADKLLINITAVALVFVSVIDFWVAAVFIARDILTVAGASILLYRDRRREFKPTLIGKLMLFFQTVALVPALLGNVDWILVYIAVALTGISAIEWVFRSEFRLVRRSDLGYFRITSLIKFADLFTLANVALGLASIVFSITSKPLLAAYMLIAAVVFDYLDGRIAHITKSSNEFGKELDSLADTISFGVAPAIFGFVLMQRQTPLTMISFGIFIFCGILRLARYNIMDMKGEYEGMPITTNGLIIPIIYFLSTPMKFYPYIYLVVGILMVSSLKMKKF